MKIIEDLRGLIEIDSVSGETQGAEMPFGEGPAEALEYTINLCKEYGFRTKNNKGLYGYGEIGNGKNLFGILVHLDVVPPGNNWETEPFSLVEKEGKLFGRGICDDKGPTIAVIHAMKELLEEEGDNLKSRIRIIFGCSEETGDWGDVEAYKREEELPTMGFTPDADFPVVYGEKGLLSLRLLMRKEDGGVDFIQGGNATNMVPDWATAKILNKNGEMKVFEEKGDSAHGSMPELGENAITKLMKKLDCKLGNEYKKVIGDSLNGEQLGCGFEDEESGRTTVNVGLVSSDDENVIIDIDVRTPISYSESIVKNSISEVLLSSEFEFEFLSWENPICLEKNGELISTLMSAYREISKDLESSPITMGGGTYARAMKNTVAFGPMFPGRELTEHQPNEYMYKEDFLEIKEIYKLALKKVSV